MSARTGPQRVAGSGQVSSEPDLDWVKCRRTWQDLSGPPCERLVDGCSGATWAWRTWSWTRRRAVGRPLWEEVKAGLHPAGPKIFRSLPSRSHCRPARDNDFSCANFKGRLLLECRTTLDRGCELAEHDGGDQAHQEAAEGGRISVRRSSGQEQVDRPSRRRTTSPSGILRR